MTALPRVLRPPPATPATGWDSSRLRKAAAADRDAALRLCESMATGLTEEEAQQRLERHGPNEIAAHRPDSWFIRLLHAVRNPLVILLAALAIISLATGDIRAATVMSLMIILG